MHDDPDGCSESDDRQEYTESSDREEWDDTKYTKNQGEPRSYRDQYISDVLREMRSLRKHIDELILEYSNLLLHVAHIHED